MVQEVNNRCPSRPIPASPTTVKEYIRTLLGPGQPMKRDEIVARVRMLAPKEGFILEPGNAIATVKKALKLLADEDIIESPRVGWWRIIQPLEQLPATPLADISEPDPVEIEAEPEARVCIEREIGNGPESVYVYYHDAYAELARRKGLSEWECKVGSTLGDPDVRVIGQGALTAFPRCPIIGLVIRTENARGLERAIHTALTLAGKRIEAGADSEWFLTSPDRVEHWVHHFWDSLTLFKNPAL